jgi:mRNA interferase RelE/StbE
MYRVKLTPTAVRMFNSLHPTIKKRLKCGLRELYRHPYCGKALRNELVRFRSLKIKRCRIIYQVDDRNKVAVVYALGHRRDIYEIVTELFTNP